MAEKKKKKFGAKASQQLKGVSIADLLKNGGTDEPEEKDNLSQETPKSGAAKTTKQDTKEPLSRDAAKPQKRHEDSEPIENKDDLETEVEEGGEVEKEEMERHFLYLRESLSTDIDLFMLKCKPKEKNKQRFFRVLLHEFFSKTPDQQNRIYKAGLKKFAHLINERD